MPIYNEEARVSYKALAGAYPAAPDSEYGWEKLFSGRPYFAFPRNIIMEIAGKKLALKHISRPRGVRGCNSDNALIRSGLGGEPKLPRRLFHQRDLIQQGLAMTYARIEGQVRSSQVRANEIRSGEVQSGQTRAGVRTESIA